MCSMGSGSLFFVIEGPSGEHRGSGGKEREIDRPTILLPGVFMRI